MAELIERVCVWCGCPDSKGSTTGCPSPDGDGHLFSLPVVNKDKRAVEILWPCPFCAGKAVVHESNGWYGVGCTTIKCYGTIHALQHKNQEAATNAWNIRQSDK